MASYGDVKEKLYDEIIRVLDVAQKDYEHLNPESLLKLAQAVNFLENTKD